MSDGNISPTFCLKFSNETGGESQTFVLNANESNEYLVHYLGESENSFTIKKVDELSVDERKASPVWFSHNSSWGDLPSGSGEWSFYSINQDLSTIWHNDRVLIKCNFVELKDGDEIKILYQNCKNPIRILYTTHVPEHPAPKLSELEKEKPDETNSSDKTKKPKKSEKPEKNDKYVASLLNEVLKSFDKKSSQLRKLTAELAEKEKKIKKIEEENPVFKETNKFTEENMALKEKMNRMDDEYENVLCKLVESEGKYKKEKEQLLNDLQNTKNELMKVRTESSVEMKIVQKKEKLGLDELNAVRMELSIEKAERQRLTTELQDAKRQCTALEEKLYQEKSTAVVTWKKLNDFRTKRSYTEMEQELTCPICQGVLQNTVSLNCGHSFCTQCIKTWRSTKDQCPTCRKKPKFQFPVLALDKVVEKMVIEAHEIPSEVQ